MPIYQIRDRACVLVAEHVRTETPSGKRMYWRLPIYRKDGPQVGLDGISTSALPLYGSQWIDRVAIGGTIILCEGESATEALWRWRIPALGTVTGASGMPGAEALGVLLPYDVVTWEDHDESGERHMRRCASWLQANNNSPRRLIWGVDKGDDAVNFRARGGTPLELTEMLQNAALWVAEPMAPKRPPTAHRERPGADEDRRERARTALVDVVTGAWGSPLRHEGRSLWWRCQFHQGDRDPSFKVDLKEPYFRCFGCDARGDVFDFKRLTENASFKDALLELAPPRLLGAAIPW